MCRKGWNDRSDVVSVCLFDGLEDGIKDGLTKVQEWSAEVGSMALNGSGTSDTL